MAKDVADDLRGGTVVDLKAGVTVPENVTSKKPGTDTCCASMMAQDMADRGRCEPAMGDLRADEDLSRRGVSRSTVAEIVRERSSYGREKRKVGLRSRLGTLHVNDPVCPVNVIQAQA
jgi:hypothetical protein